MLKDRTAMKVKQANRQALQPPPRKKPAHQNAAPQHIHCPQNHLTGSPMYQEVTVMEAIRKEGNSPLA